MASLQANPGPDGLATGAEKASNASTNRQLRERRGQLVADDLEHLFIAVADDRRCVDT